MRPRRLASLCPVMAIDRAELAEQPRPAPRALGEALHIILLVGGMDAVIVERETDQQTLQAEPGAEGLHNRNRCAAANDEWRLAPFLLERVRGGLENWSRRVEADRGRSAFVGK